MFNKNNRHKMQKSDYVKNTQGEGITTDILEVHMDETKMLIISHADATIVFLREYYIHSIYSC